ncbi:cell division protein FtsQ/DivIB [Sinanaerobacter chloroacetimidivorans]|jgi:cell division protein FtsQ|uniref:FtsQ-type POTRA domain-containing protein n=1 Tax=Sinanaerobacter chloroacetimidivorans TaxID=2818044 RepID=A0A8J7VXU0_9FIRM|nr:FtsQ-type POTRA domain-containing protein [Sinanaerobacter chloroacetimidivorans]MBR0597062.1 FtsQ-type POTRA domain-containing protein [Sinanaerobacter chloroacetimidivorans]
MKKGEKIKKKKKRKKKHYFLKFLLIAASATGVYFLLTSSVFDIDKITVENNRYYTAEQVISLTEAKTGENLFEVSLSGMKDKLLADPYIKNAKLSRKLPGEVVIHIEERQEDAAVPYGGNYIIIDNEGMVLRKSEVEPALTLLLGMTVKNMEPGTPLEVEENASLTDTLKLLEEVKKHELFFKKIDINKIIIKAYIYDQLTCEGTPENILNNLDSLQEVLYDLYTKGIERGVIKMGSDKYFSFSPLVE